MSQSPTCSSPLSSAPPSSQLLTPSGGSSIIVHIQTTTPTVLAATPSSPASTSPNIMVQTRAQKRNIDAMDHGRDADHGHDNAPPLNKVAVKSRALAAKPKASVKSQKAAPKKTAHLSDSDSEQPAFAEPIARSKSGARPVKTPLPNTKPFTKELTLVSEDEDELAIVEESIVKPTRNAKVRTPPNGHTQSTRPARNAKPPKRLGEELEEEVKTKKPTPPCKSTSRVFNPTYVTTNSGSRLVKADVYHMLLERPAWTSLSAEQQIRLISMLPQTKVNQDLLEKIQSGSVGEGEDTRPQAFTINSTRFADDVAAFKTSLEEGRLAKTWQVSAEHAVVSRANGDFDQWKAEEAERWWGQKGEK